MALLSSFRVGFETVYPDSLRARLRSFPLLKDLSDPALRRLLAQATWFGLPGGTLLPRDGENDRALFLVVTGSLGVFAEIGKEERRLVAHVSSGETIGEMSLISNEPHTAEFVALRDTELLRISREGFQTLMTRHPMSCSISCAFSCIACRKAYADRWIRGPELSRLCHCRRDWTTSRSPNVSPTR
jgi:NTE family protein